LRRKSSDDTDVLEITWLEATLEKPFDGLHFFRVFVAFSDFDLWSFAVYQYNWRTFEQRT